MKMENELQLLLQLPPPSLTASRPPPWKPRTVDVALFSRASRRRAETSSSLNTSCSQPGIEVPTPGRSFLRSAEPVKHPERVSANYGVGRRGSLFRKLGVRL